MLGIPIENHAAVTVMTAAYARDVMRVHELPARPLVCAKKRQAIARLVEARLTAAADASRSRR